MTNKRKFLCCALALGLGIFSVDSQAGEANGTFQYKGENDVRPKNFYALKKATDSKLCDQILTALNESFKNESYPNNLPLRNLTGNSHSVKWHYVEDKYGRPTMNAFAEKGDGKYYFRKFWSMGSGGAESLAVVTKEQLDMLKVENFLPLKDTEIDMNAGKRIIENGAETFVPSSLYKGFPDLSFSEVDLIRFENLDVVLVGGGVVPQFCSKKYPVIAHEVNSDSEAKPICKFESMPTIYCPEK